MATMQCRVQYLDDTDPFSSTSTNFPEPPRPPTFTFLTAVPLQNQIAGVKRLLKAPHKLEECALQLCRNNGSQYDYGIYLDLEATLDEQEEDLEGFTDSKRNAIILRTQLSVRVKTCIDRLTNSSDKELRRALFSLKQIFQDDKDLVHEFVTNGGLDCFILLGHNADQNYQNYILRALGQVMLYVDGMNGVISHNGTIQWLYSLTTAKHRLVVKTALKLLLVFVEYSESNTPLLLDAINSVDQGAGLKPWTNIMSILGEKESADSELLVYAITLINKTLNAVGDQELFFDVTDVMEELGMERIVLYHTTQHGASADPLLVEQLLLYESVLRHEDGLEPASRDYDTIRKTPRTKNEEKQATEKDRRKSRRFVASQTIGASGGVRLNLQPMTSTDSLSRGADLGGESAGQIERRFVSGGEELDEGEEDEEGSTATRNGQSKITNYNNNNTASESNIDEMAECVNLKSRKRRERQKSLVQEMSAIGHHTLLADLTATTESSLAHHPTQAPQPITAHQLNTAHPAGPYQATQPSISQPGGPANGNMAVRGGGLYQRTDGTDAIGRVAGSWVGSGVGVVGVGVGGTKNYGGGGSSHALADSNSLLAQGFIMVDPSSPSTSRKPKPTGLQPIVSQDLQPTNLQGFRGRGGLVPGRQSIDELILRDSQPLTAPLISQHEPIKGSSSIDLRQMSTSSSLDSGQMSHPMRSSLDNQSASAYHSTPVSDDRSVGHRSIGLSVRPLDQVGLWGGGAVPQGGAFLQSADFKEQILTAKENLSNNRRSPQKHLGTRGMDNEPRDGIGGTVVKAGPARAVDAGPVLTVPTEGRAKIIVPTAVIRKEEQQPLQNTTSTAEREGREGLEVVTTAPSSGDLTAYHTGLEDTGSGLIDRPGLPPPLPSTLIASPPPPHPLTSLPPPLLINTLSRAEDSTPLSVVPPPSTRPVTPPPQIITPPSPPPPRVVTPPPPPPPVKTESQIQWEKIESSLSLDKKRKLCVKDLDFTDLTDLDDINCALVSPPPPSPSPQHHTQLPPSLGGSIIPPAPPPPPGGTLAPPPPPPPPLLSSSFTSPLGATPPSKSARVKTVKLHWKEAQPRYTVPTTGATGEVVRGVVGVKLGGDVVGSRSVDTIWTRLVGEIGRVSVENAKLDHLFESKSHDMKTKAVDGGTRKKLAILDPKRSNAINIALTALPRTDCIKDAILKMDSSVVNREGIEKIHQLLPTEEEMSRINEAQGSNPDTPLGSAERFLQIMDSIPDLQARLQLWAFKLDYDIAEAELADPLSDLKKGMKELENNKTFKYILATLLSIGNFLNGTEAVGFTVEYLMRVPEVKDTVHKHSLLHHLVNIVTETFPDSTDLYSELGAISRCAKIDWNELARRLDRLEEECKTSWDSLRAIAKHDNVMILKNKLSEFLNDCAERIIVLKIVHRRVLNRFTRFLLYLGYSSDASLDFNPGSFCKLISEFALEYRTARDKVIALREKRASQRERKKTRGVLIVETKNFKRQVSAVKKKTSLSELSEEGGGVGQGVGEGVDGEVGERADSLTLDALLDSRSADSMLMGGAKSRRRASLGTAKLNTVKGVGGGGGEGTSKTRGGLSMMSAVSEHDISELPDDDLLEAVVRTAAATPSASLDAKPRERRRARTTRKSLRRTLKSGLTIEEMNVINNAAAAHL